jgi:tetratricopeptide (TPR) repeat protein
MKTYTSRDVAQILGLSLRVVQRQARAGYLAPGRGPGSRYRFSFQDLILLRTAKALARAGLSARRIRSGLRRLRADLPSGRSLSGIRISANGHEIVVRDGKAAWQPESGQLVFDFAVSELARSAAPYARRGVEAARKADHALTAEEWYALGCELEATAPDQARDAYRRALELNPALADAHVNLGRLLQEAGAAAAAVEQYRSALDTEPHHATAAYNLGIALEDLGRRQDAIAAYTQALSADPGFADAHYNLARLYEKTGRKQAALRHLAQYKRLTER